MVLFFVKCLENISENSKSEHCVNSGVLPPHLSGSKFRKRQTLDNNFFYIHSHYTYLIKCSSIFILSNKIVWPFSMIYWVMIRVVQLPYCFQIWRSNFAEYWWKTNCTVAIYLNIYIYLFLIYNIDFLIRGFFIIKL